MFKIAYHPIFSHPLLEEHRFPMQKYEWLPQQLLLEGVVAESDFFEPEILTADIVKMAHQDTYVDAVLQLKLSSSEIRRIGFPMSEQLVERELRIAQGTVDGANFALKDGVAFNIAGGTHHAGSNWGEGFCIFNDQAIASHYLIAENKVRKVAIIDLDVHQGNGTAEIFQNQAGVYTFSIHGAHNFPFRKEKSTWDLALDDAVEDVVYLKLLELSLLQIFENFQPEFVFYQAGVDVLETDRLGKFAITLRGCQQRDAIVFNMCKKFKTPVQVSMGGGYSKDVKTIVQAHCNTFKTAVAIFGT